MLHLSISITGISIFNVERSRLFFAYRRKTRVFLRLLISFLLFFSNRFVLEISVIFPDLFISTIRNLVSPLDLGIYSIFKSYNISSLLVVLSSFGNSTVVSCTFFGTNEMRSRGVHVYMKKNLLGSSWIRLGKVKVCS